MLFAAILGLFLQTSITDLTRNSSIIFSGRVERVQAATAGLPSSKDTAIVHVDEVLYQPSDIAPLGREPVTVRFREGGAPAPGEEVVFFTTLYAGGKSLGLDAVGIVRDLPPDNAKATLAKARDTILDEDIAARLATSALVISGVVRAVRRLEERDNDRVSEHDPEWAVADVSIDSNVKGETANQKTVTIYFASSRDALYTQWPKLREGDRIIVVAQQSDPRLRFAFERSRQKPQGPFVVDRADVQPAAELERVRRLSR
jgi:hypothetical protein